MQIAYMAAGRRWFARFAVDCKLSVLRSPSRDTAKMPDWPVPARSAGQSIGPAGGRPSSTCLTIRITSAFFTLTRCRRSKRSSGKDTNGGTPNGPQSLPGRLHRQRGNGAGLADDRRHQMRARATDDRDRAPGQPGSRDPQRLLACPVRNLFGATVKIA